MLDFPPLTINGGLWLVFMAVWVIESFFVFPTKSRETTLQRMQYVIPLYAGFYLIFDHRYWGPLHQIFLSHSVRQLGNVVTAAGIGWAIWARLVLGRNWSGYVTLKQGHQLIRTGPYRVTRHPIYTGLALAVSGSAIACGRIDGWVGVVIITLSFVFKLQREESLMTAEFGEQYQLFKQQVPAAIIPGIY